MKANYDQYFKFLQVSELEGKNFMFSNVSFMNLVAKLFDFFQGKILKDFIKVFHRKSKNPPFANLLSQNGYFEFNFY